jgi:flagellar FliL protein
MAEDNEQDQDNQQEEQGPKGSKTSAKKKEIIVSWSVMGGIILLFALSGFFLGKVLVETLKADPIVAAQIAGMSPSGLSEAAPKQEAVGDEKTWFYDLLPVVANLDDPGATRYIRTTLTLEIYDSLDQDEGEEMLKKKAPHMRNWLTIYLASLSLDEAHGEKNLKRIQSHVLEEFNQMLFPNETPQISHILLKDFAIQ